MGGGIELEGETFSPGQGARLHPGPRSPTAGAMAGPLRIPIPET